MPRGLHRPRLLARDAGRLALAGAAATAALASGCAGGGQSPANAEPTPKATVLVTDGAYVPDHVKIKPGERVTFVNTADDGNTAETLGAGFFEYDREAMARRKDFDIHTLRTGEAESVRLVKPGTYVYYSSLDSRMRGVIEVTAP